MHYLVFLSIMDMLSGWIAFMHILDTVYVKVVTWINELAWMPVGYPKAIDAVGTRVGDAPSGLNELW